MAETTQSAINNNRMIATSFKKWCAIHEWVICNTEQRNFTDEELYDIFIVEYDKSINKYIQ